MSRTVVEFTAAGGPPATGGLVYEVTLDVARRAARRLDAWLAEQLREMLALPGFLAARVLPADQVAPAPEARCVRRVVQYRLADYAALRVYLAEHGARMGAKGLREFGKQLHSSSRLLDAEGRELLSGDVLPAVTPRCLNCNAVLTGEYCSVCGQPHHDVVAPLREVAGEFFGEHFGLDTKLIRSAVPLLCRPGFLSREYSAGRRVRYISPLRLYVFCSLLFFFAAWAAAPRQFFTFNAVPAATAKPDSGTLASVEQRQMRSASQPAAQDEHGVPAAAASAGDRPAAVPSAAAGNLDLEIFGRHISMPRSEFQSRVESGLEHNIPKFMFLFLPLVALLLTLFYLRTGRYYVEHLVFTLHNHAFVFSAMLIQVLVNLAARHAHWLARPAHYFNLLLGWYIVAYIFLAMLYYYRQSFIKTLGKYILVGGIYWIVLLSVFVIDFVAVIMYSMAA